MDESALRLLLSHAEACRSVLHFWLEFWTAVVVVGVTLEVFYVIKEYRNDLHDYRRAIIHPPEKPSVLLLTLGLLGAALVAVGVAGELWADAKIETAETEIRKLNNDLSLLLSKEAGDAKASADGAASAAAKAEASATRATKEEEELRQKVGWRHLSDSDWGNLVQTLHPFAGQKYSLFVAADTGTAHSDSEIDDFRDQLDSAMGRAHWDYVNSGRMGAGSSTGVTVKVLSSRTPSTDKAATALVSWLSSHRKQAVKEVLDVKKGGRLDTFSEKPVNPSEGIEIIVGKRI